jgi:hypothetical protein
MGPRPTRAYLRKACAAGAPWTRTTQPHGPHPVRGDGDPDPDLDPDLDLDLDPDLDPDLDLDLDPDLDPDLDLDLDLGARGATRHRAASTGTEPT